MFLIQCLLINVIFCKTLCRSFSLLFFFFIWRRWVGHHEIWRHTHIHTHTNTTQTLNNTRILLLYFGQGDTTTQPSIQQDSKKRKKRKLKTCRKKNMFYAHAPKRELFKRAESVLRQRRCRCFCSLYSGSLFGTTQHRTHEEIKSKRDEYYKNVGKCCLSSL